MHKTQHIEKRQNQRGISDAMITQALLYGTPMGDKSVFGNKEVDARIAELNEEEKEIQQQLRVLKKIRDKQGITVVEADNTLITTYNIDKRPRH